MLRIPIGSIQTPARAGALAAVREYDQPNINSYKTLITRTLDLSVEFNLPALTPYPLFNISGTVVTVVAAQCTEDVVSDQGVIVSIGVTSDLDAVLGQVNRISIGGTFSGEWLAADNVGPFNSRKYGPFISDFTEPAYLVQEDEQIMWDIMGCGTITDGTVVVYCWYLPLDEECLSTVTLA